MSKEDSRKVADSQRARQQATGVLASVDRGQLKPSQYRLSSLFFANAVAASILAAFVACKDTYEIHGAVGSSLVPILLGLFVACCIPFLISQRLRRAVCVLMIVGCIAFSIRQTILKMRMRDLKTEVTQIIAFLEEYSSENGKYPDDLSGYTFRNPRLKPYVVYNNPPYSPYAILFHPSKYTGIGHWYYPGHGYYFEDD